MKASRMLSVLPIELEGHRTVHVEETLQEGVDSLTVMFRDAKCRKAGPAQFVSIWLPGVGETQMSLSRLDEDGYSGITVKPFGSVSRRICELKRKEMIGVRGPYGRGFTVKRGKALLVGGGTGLSPLIPQAIKLLDRGSEVTLVSAARTARDLLFVDRAKALFKGRRARLILVTEDGSAGVKGLATEAAAPLIKASDMVYTCGPERMMHRLFALTEEAGVPMEASLERLMECAIGICGICSLERYLVCRDGPVFTSEQLREVASEFGSFRRDLTGRKVGI